MTMIIYILHIIVLIIIVVVVLFLVLLQDSIIKLFQRAYHPLVLMFQLDNHLNKLVLTMKYVEYYL